MPEKSRKSRAFLLIEVLIAQCFLLFCASMLIAFCSFGKTQITAIRQELEKETPLPLQGGRPLQLVMRSCANPLALDAVIAVCPEGI